LNSLLELAGPDRITEITYLTPEQKIPVDELKLSIVDVKCRDASDRVYVVEMQLFNVEALEKRVVYNVSKSYVMQIHSGERYMDLTDVVGVTICDFQVWPEPPSPGGPEVPMLSRWRMQEQHGGARGLSEVQYVFLELPKYAAGTAPETTVDHWAYFFREAENLEVIPPALAEDPYRSALEVARTSSFTPREWDAYDRAKVAEQDARGAISLAAHQGQARGFHRGRVEGLAEGHERGLSEGLRRSAVEICDFLGIELGPERREQLKSMTAEEVGALLAGLKRERRWTE
jgi:predicted transposase/invertase (TIGR01784 family)